VLPGGNTFMQLTDVSAFSVVAAFPQDQAVQINSGSHAKVSIDALAGKSVDGTVTAVSPIGTPGVNGAPMYYATVLLDKNQVPDDLKSGLTANVSVVLSTIENKALVVPTAAVTQDDGQPVVEVPGSDGRPQQKKITRGKVGDDNTEVISGLKRGDTVLIPDSGPLPTPANDHAPNVPNGQALTFERVDPPAPAPQPQGPAAVAAPTDATTYPGDPGDLPDDGSTADGAGGSPTAGMGGVNPFAAPAAPNTPGN
jgi:HlyD family secretion protein